ncbi:MAG: ParA family protein [Chloroflexi bacterium]|nr:ParA family protein [Chloroflexota bacterium]
MGETIACANQKGGVGKTTTVVNLAAYLALEGQQVLVVDIDPQGNATSGLGHDKATVERSMYEALVGGSAARSLIVPTAIAGLSLIPASTDLAGLEIELVPLERRERRLRTVLEPLREEFDYVLFDCPPSVGLITINALTAADSVLIPLQCEYYALEGLSQLLATINLVRDHLNPSLRIKGVLLTMYDARTTLSADVSAEVRRHLGDRVFETRVPRSVRLSEAPSYGQPVALYSPGSKGAEAYRNAATELLRRDGHVESAKVSVGVPQLAGV